jgi:hypothetical protein
MSEGKTVTITRQSSCGGCLVFILVIIAFWALVAGVNIGGKHYELSCGDNGVNIDTGK